MRALILVDLQNDFIPGGALAVSDGAAVIPVANRLLAERGRLFDFVVATQDWHPAGHESFASSHGGKSVGSFIDLHGVQQILWPDHCVQESHGAGFVDGLMLSRIDQVFKKGMNPAVDSYSGFFDNARRGDTGLDQWLRERDVKKLTVMGLATDYCVKFTVLDALSLGYQTEVVTDGCRGVNVLAGDDRRAFDETRASGAAAVSLADLLARGDWRISK
jgi:nicotinamidase/pyrazinamidase